MEAVLMPLSGLAGYPELGQRGGEERRGGGGWDRLLGRELPGEGQGAALLQEFPGIMLQR